MMFCKKCNTLTLVYDRQNHTIACYNCGLVHDYIDKKLLDSN